RSRRSGTHRNRLDFFSLIGQKRGVILSAIPYQVQSASKNARLYWSPAMKRLFFPVLVLVFAAAAFSAGAAIFEPYAISTVAGWGDNSDTVDGPRHTAKFNDPHGLAVDTAGNVYVVEVAGHVIRKITPQGVASTFAGKAGEPGIADGTGGDARFNSPQGVAIGPDGMIYVADTLNQTIRKITPDAVVTTFAGHPGVPGFRDGVGLGARFDQPAGVTVTEAGDLFVAEEINHAVRKITPDATVTTFSQHLEGFPEDIIAQSDGNLYVVATASIGKLIKITPDGVWGYFGDYGVGWANGLVAD